MAGSSCARVDCGAGATGVCGCGSGAADVCYGTSSSEVVQYRAGGFDDRVVRLVFGTCLVLPICKDKEINPGKMRIHDTAL